MPSTAGLESGSSPLARGTRGYRVEAQLRDGLIPARAGNTMTAAAGLLALGAHPRSRGEHLVGPPTTIGR